MTNLPKFGIENLYLFPYFQTQEDYEKWAHEPCPVFDITKPPKHWVDTNYSARNYSASLLGRPRIIYEHVLAMNNGVALPDEKGKPLTEPLILDRNTAISVNILPPSTTGLQLLPAIPPPLRRLYDWEELEFGFGNTVVVLDKRYRVRTQDEKLDEIISLLKELKTDLSYKVYGLHNQSTTTILPTESKTK